MSDEIQELQIPLSISFADSFAEEREVLSFIEPDELGVGFTVEVDYSPTDLVLNISQLVSHNFHKLAAGYSCPAVHSVVFAELSKEEGRNRVGVICLIQSRKPLYLILDFSG